MSRTERPTLLLIPGLLCDEGLWRHQINTLTDVADCVVGDVSAHNSIYLMARSALEQA